MTENKLIYESNRKISSAFIDSTVKLGIAQAVLLLQDNLSECFNAMNCDGIIVREKFNAFWVFTKTKVHFFDRPDWREEVIVKTYPIDNAGMRSHVNSEICSKEGRQLIIANQEVCALNYETHRPMKIADLSFPKEGFPPAVFEEPFERFPSDFTEDELVYEQKILSCQIDLSHHLNNIEYIKLALSVFSDDFLQLHTMENLEVHYTGESKEGQILKIYRRDLNGRTYVHIKESGRNVFECCIEFR